MLVTTDELTEHEARDLSRDIQTAREHSLREVGKRYLKLQTGGMTQGEIAEAERVTQGTVSRAIAAATISDSVATLFDDINALSNRNYQFLVDVDAAFLTASDDQKSNLCERVKELRERPEHSEKSAEERKDAIIRELKNWLEDHQAQAPSKEVREDLIRPRRGMRAVVKKTKHSVVFHLTKLPEETAATIETFIRDTLKNLANK